MPGGGGPNAVVGGVDYGYQIGKYEVTNGQYAAFLNAVAVRERHGLYNPEMASGWKDIGGIIREGEQGSYSYSVRPGRENRPVNYVSFWDSLRFANWLHNGQPTGRQDASTTESGAYLLGGITEPPNESVHRALDARVWLPSEDEWYKAAYYDPALNDGAGGYWDYATQSDTAPTSEPPPGTDPINGSANYWPNGGNPALGPPDYTTEVGAYASAAGPYGTFDQSGNVLEWNEAIFPDSFRGSRGGSFDGFELHLRASRRLRTNADREDDNIGFRVAQIPEPTGWGLLLVSVPLLRRGRRKTHGQRRKSLRTRLLR